MSSPQAFTSGFVMRASPPQQPPHHTPPPPPPPTRGRPPFPGRARDSEEDREEPRRFHEDLPGLPLVHRMESGHVPGTGKYGPGMHLFFQMRGGSHIAFFGLGEGAAALPSPNTPAWVNRIALRVDSALAELRAAKARWVEQRTADAMAAWMRAL